MEWQLRIAAGEPLTLRQDGVQPHGHAIECRIYAEDPYRDFFPSTGTLLRWRPPSGPGLRLDSGVAEGQEVSIYYDPMLAKLIAWAPTREQSLRRMSVALSQFLALGVITNIPLLRAVVEHPQFQRGEYDTAFLEWNPAVTRPAITGETRTMARALAAWASQQPVSAASPQNPTIPTTPSVIPAAPYVVPATTSVIPAKAGIHHPNPWQSAGQRRLP